MAASIGQYKSSLGAENLVTCISKSWKDVSNFVENGIDSSTVYFDVGVLGMDGVDALHDCYKDDGLDLLAAFGLEEVDCGNNGAAGSEHRVDDDSDTVFNVGAHLVKVMNGLQSLFVAIETND